MILRDVTDEDLLIFFEHQRDPEALRMAAFPSRDRDAFMTHWRSNVLRPGNLTCTIVVSDQVVGYIGSWEQDEKRLVGYWIGREYWGQGIATRTLDAFLEVETTRPLHARVALENCASIRVLEKSGFRAVDEHRLDGAAECLMVLGG